jgi:hypothetical protein
LETKFFCGFNDGLGQKRPGQHITPNFDSSGNFKNTMLPSCFFGEKSISCSKPGDITGFDGTTRDFCKVAFTSYWSSVSFSSVKSVDLKISS